MGQYLFNLWAATSQLLNVSLLNGNPRESISSRCFTAPWPTAIKIINTLMFWQVNHCRSAYTNTLKWAQEFTKLNEKLP